MDGKIDSRKKILIEISDQELHALTDAINTKYGIDFTNYEKKSLKRGFARLIARNKFESILDFWRLILSANEFPTEYIDELTINLTELFRNNIVWKKLEQVIIKELNWNHAVRIWHAGCSTGEEVSSMMILLKKNQLSPKTFIWATDLSNSAVNKARKAMYPMVLYKKYEKGFLNFYHSPTVKMTDFFNVNSTAQSFSLKTELLSNVTFEVHNLINDPVSNKYDIIFCRNVMIYFDDFLKMKVLRKLFNSLRKGGFLVIGFYDSMPLDHRLLFDLYDAQARIYRRKDAEEVEEDKMEALTAYDRLKKLIQQRDQNKKV